ncbi:AAA family ATPase [Dethiothermospora halolimnae]|uniref:AAA family ATPase n=1 Tax=Dethiothermospora halolimnae TaxID=3114390 RepID=UPI003CCBCAE8
MRIPYGISDFKTLREQGYLYVDKTKYIEMLEDYDSKYMFFIRPRRFGKSLFLSTLSYYYDMNYSDEFNDIFKDLYISKNPTVLKNSYFMLELDFSGLNTSNKETLEYSFKSKLREAIIRFLYKYKQYFDDIIKVEKEIKEVNDVGAILGTLTTEIQKIDKKIYLIIDEYDHFANDIIAMGDSHFYKDIIRASGFVRDFYETVKIGTKSVIDRIFITGISPIMLDDLTSGFNIASNTTMDRNLNEMMGFTDREVDETISKLQIQDVSKNREELRKNYNGYLFNKHSKNRIYNPDMVLYFFNQYKTFGEYPEELIDENVKTDYGRLNRLVSNEENRKVLDEIIVNEGIVADIVTRFSFDRMYDEDYFVSLLFYMGLLTIDRQERTRLLLKVPNYVVKTIFWEYIENSLKKNHNIKLETKALRLSIEDMAYDGNIKSYIDYIHKNVIKPLSNRDLMNFDERYIKVILFAYLVNSKVYKPISEREVENGYIDIYLEKDIRMPEVNYEWIIELKYIKKSERNKLEEVKKEGLKQLKGYVDSREFKDREHTKQALIVFVGKDEYEVVEI